MTPSCPSFVGYYGVPGPIPQEPCGPWIMKASGSVSGWGGTGHRSRQSRYQVQLLGTD